LPYEAHGSVWGKEVYFKIPEELDFELENGQDPVEVGDLGYWPTGKAFCIFYGPTPASVAERLRPVSPVAIFGKLFGDITLLSSMKTDVTVFIERKE
jgi:hypothetical protein